MPRTCAFLLLFSTTCEDTVWSYLKVTRSVYNKKLAQRLLHVYFKFNKLNNKHTHTDDSASALPTTAARRVFIAFRWTMASPTFTSTQSKQQPLDISSCLLIGQHSPTIVPPKNVHTTWPLTFSLTPSEYK